MRGIRGGISYLQAGVIQKLSIELNMRELFRDFTGSAQKQTIGHLHDSSLVHGADLLPANRLCMLKRKSQDALGGLPGDQLDTLYNPLNDDVLDAGVLSLGILTNQDGVDVVVGGLVPSNGATWADIGKEVEGAAEGQVEGNMAFADGGLLGGVLVCCVQ